MRSIKEYTSRQLSINDGPLDLDGPSQTRTMGFHTQESQVAVEKVIHELLDSGILEVWYHEITIQKEPTRLGHHDKPIARKTTVHLNTRELFKDLK